MPEYLLTAEHKNFHADYRKAKNLRQQSPPAEQKLWDLLRQLSKATGLKFRRRHPVHPYIVDFECLKARLVIEIDGMSHDGRQEEDRIRTAYLHKEGFTVIRFSNEDVQTDRKAVANTIWNKVQEIIKELDAPLP